MLPIRACAREGQPAARAANPGRCEIGADLMNAHALQESDELNFEWNSRLLFQRLLHTREHGNLVYQRYAVPWPLAPRDTLLSCDRRTHKRDMRVTSVCSSVEHADVPLTPAAVRLELSHTGWEILSLPGDRTHIHLELELPAHVANGVPKAIINYCQRSSLRDSVASFLEAVDRLNLAPHPAYTHWRRTRAELAAAQAMSPPSAGGWGSVPGLASSLALLLLATIITLLQAGAVGFAFALCRMRGGSSQSPPDTHKSAERAASRIVAVWRSRRVVRAAGLLHAQGS